jgi:hypothetical protein
MDRALSKYGKVEDPERWVDDALELARTCRDVDGLWVGLWHPNLTAPLGFPGAPAAFGRLLATLRGHQPYVDRLDRIVEWRAARRTLRARAITPDGSVVLTAGVRWQGQVMLQDRSGTPVEQVPWPEAP